MISFECCPICKGKGKVKLPKKKTDRVRKIIIDLHAKGWPMRRIMSVTGHKSVSTIAHYIK